MAKNRIRSQLGNLPELKARLAKIKTQKVLIHIGSARLNAADCPNFLIDETAESDQIQFNRPDDLLEDVAATLVIQGCTFTATPAGLSGNDLSIVITDGATAGAEVISVSEGVITCQIQDGVTTRTQLKTAIDAEGDVNSLIDVAVTSGGTAVAVTEGAVAASLVLQGCTFTAFPAGTSGNALSVVITDGATAGEEVISISEGVITCQVQSGVTTRTQLKTAIDAETDVNGLIDIAITSGGTVVTTAAEAPLEGGEDAEPVSLAGGLDADPAELYDLSDIYEIRRIRTKKWVIELRASADPLTSD